MKRRAVPAPSSLTSLVDVLFILVFAALVQRAAASASSSAALPAPVVAPIGPPASARWQPPPANEELRQRAIRELAAAMQGRPAVIARVTARGVLTSLELAQSAGDAPPAPGARLALELPLLERVEDPDIAVGYLGDRDATRRICALIAARLPEALAESALVVIAVDESLRDLMIALVGGLRRDVERCGHDHGAAAVLLDSTSLAPARGVDADDRQPEPAPPPRKEPP
ncbi:MAG: hypothetical protein R3B48_13330 [Kofleriaceae bacterium]